MTKVKSGSNIDNKQTRSRNVKRRLKKAAERVVKDKATFSKEKRQLLLKEEEERGLVYVGHIPHGFYEDEMRKYFKQFGKVTNVKVCRSNRTGKSKGYGYVEFALPEVAKIAAETMNNYVMFKKRVVAEYVPPEKRPRYLFHGNSSTATNFSLKNRRARQITLHNKNLNEKTWPKKAKATVSKLNKKLDRLNKLGVKCAVTPEGWSDIKGSSDDTQSFIQDPDDSDIEFKVPKTAARKTSSKNAHLKKLSSKESLITMPSSRNLLAKSLESVRTLLSKGSVSKVKEEQTQTKPVKVKRGITKKAKAKKPVPMNAEVVKKIARELIRKKGTSLINILPPEKKGKKSKKSK